MSNKMECIILILIIAVEYDEDDDYEYEGEVEAYSRAKFENSNCDERVEYTRKIASFKNHGEVSSIMTIRVEERFRSYNKNRKAYTKPSHLPTDATLENKTFCTQNFFVSESFLLNNCAFFLLYLKLARHE